MNRKEFWFSLSPLLFLLGTFVITISAWLTHVIYCIIDGSWGFLIAGAILFPVAIIHGIMIWLGVV